MEERDKKSSADDKRSGNSPVTSTNGVVSTNGKTAIMINANAMRVNKKIQKEIKRHTPKAEMYLTTSLEEAKQAARKIVTGGYSRVISAGGDGTIIHLINLLYEVLREENSKETRTEPFKMPAIGIIKLGTGNAWAQSVMAPNPRKDAEELDDIDSYVTVPFSLIEAEGRLFPFAGFGWDAQVVNDYHRTSTYFKSNPAFPNFHGLWAYLLATFGLTIPRNIFQRPKWDVCATATGRNTFMVDERDILRPVDSSSGKILYEGPLTFLGVSTIKHYGFSMNVFPLARKRPHLFNLRIFSEKLPATLANVRKMWMGTLRCPKLSDYLLDNVTLEFGKPIPFHIGGEAEGYRDRINLKVHNEFVNIINYQLK